MVCGTLAGAEVLAFRAGWLTFLPGLPSPMMIVALWLYWGALWWPLRVFLARRVLRGARAANLVRVPAILGPLVASYALFVEPLWLEAERVELRHADVRGKEIRIAHLSDLQLVDFGPREAAVLAAVAAFRPHLIVCSGDYVTATIDEAPAIAAARHVFGSLRASHGIYATTSDSNTEAQARAIFRDLPVTYLLNRGVSIEVEGTPVRITGVNHFFPRWDLVRKGASPDELVLVVCHQPDLAADCEARVPEADVFFCGHTHGGQLQIPFFGPLITFTRRTERHVAAGGVFPRASGMTLFLSRGIGMEGEYAPRFRLGCRPHLFLLTMRGTLESK